MPVISCVLACPLEMESPSRSAELTEIADSFAPVSEIHSVRGLRPPQILYATVKNKSHGKPEKIVGLIPGTHRVVTMIAAMNAAPRTEVQG